MGDRRAECSDIGGDLIDSYEVRDHPAQLVRRVHQRGAHLFTQAVTYPNLSVTQFVALVTLLKSGPLAQSHLGRTCSMDPSTTTMVIRKLAREGLIEKSRSKEDQRTSMIALTPAGQDCAYAHIPVSIEAGTQLLEPLTEIEQDLFLSLLRKILDDTP